MKARVAAALLFVALGLALGVAGSELYRTPAVPPPPPPAVTPPGLDIEAREADFWPAFARASVDRKERTLHRLLTQLKTIPSSSVYNFTIYELYGGVLEQHRAGGVRDARILEIGPGINLSTGLVFVMSGAAKYSGLDIFRHRDLLAAAQYESVAALYRVVVPRQIRTPAAQIMTIRDGQVELDPKRIEYLYPRQSYDIPLPDDSIDYVFSHSTMEHVSDPMRTVEAIHRVLAPGGLTAHNVDLRDHADFAKPFEFLKLDAAAWADKLRGQHTHLYLNRWRASDFRAAFQRVGFRILRFEAMETQPMTEEVRRSLAREFQTKSLEDLSITELRIVAKKR